MALSLLQLSLAITPALVVSALFNHIKLPWENQKRPAERAELLSLLARDVKHVKRALGAALAALNTSASCAVPKLPLKNWNRIKRDPRLAKYRDEKIFKDMIRQFKEWEKMNV